LKLSNRFRKLKHDTIRSLYASNSFLIQKYIELWTPKANSIEEFLWDTADEMKDFFVLQIGANDGYINDPLVKLIRKGKWKGVLLEPQKLVFDQYLTPLYSHYKDIHLVNAAIGTKSEKRDLYTISFSAERWATGLATFVKESLEAQVREGYIDKCIKKYESTAPLSKADYINTQQVNCITFSEIIQQYQIQQIDLLQIDTEGFDFEVIKMFPFELMKPKIISFESERLSTTAFNECKIFLIQKGYNVSDIGRDAVAVRL
jgi:FkbM family methyltransferase